MAGNYTKLVTVVTGQTITASERNNEFDNVINNMTPDGVDDASATLAAMRNTADPAGGSLATSLRGELERLRFQVLKLGSATGYWYDALPFLAGLTPAAPGVTATDLTNRLAQLASQIKTGFGLTNWYDSPATVLAAYLLKAGGTMTGAIAMGGQKITGLAAGTVAGDATRYEQVVLTTGDQTISGVKTFDGQLIGKGTATNDSPAAGYIGQVVETIQSAGVTAAATGTYKEVASISLPAGDWDVTGLVQFEGQGGATSFTALGNMVALIGTTTASATGTTLGYDRIQETPQATSVAAYRKITIPRKIVKIASTTTYYLNASCVFTSTAPQLYGFLSARRMR